MEKAKKRVIAVICVLFWLAVWQAGAMLLNKKILLVSPIDVLLKLKELVPKPEFRGSILFSAGRILLGYFAGVAVGVLLALLAGRFSAARQLFAPLVAVVKSIPVASFTILALIWISSKNLSVMVSFLICVPIVYTNMLEGIDALDGRLKEMATVFRIPWGKRFVGVYLSQLLPYFRSASALAIGLCWKSGVAAELIGIPTGSIGERLYMSKVYLNTADLFAWTLMIVLLSSLCELALSLLIKGAGKAIERM